MCVCGHSESEHSDGDGICMDPNCDCVEFEFCDETDYRNDAWCLDPDMEAQ